MGTKIELEIYFKEGIQPIYAVVDEKELEDFRNALGEDIVNDFVEIVDSFRTEVIGLDKTKVAFYSYKYKEDD